MDTLVRGIEGAGGSFDPAREGWVMEPEPRFAGQIGPFWRKHVDDGEAVGILVDQRHLNRYGVVHGGVYVALFDESLGPPCYQALGQDAQLSTVHMGSLLLSPAQAGDFLTAVSQVTRTTASIVFARGECRVGDRTVMTGDAIVKIRAKAAGFVAPATPPRR